MHREQRCGPKPFDSRPPEAALYSIKPPICFEQAPRSIVGTHNSDPMMKSDERCQKESLMTRKLLLTAAIVALALTPPIGTGTARPAVLVVGSGAASPAASVVSIPAITGMPISRTATTVTDHLQLAP
jgi:hypothetical protein